MIFISACSRQQTTTRWHLTILLVTMVTFIVITISSYVIFPCCARCSRDYAGSYGYQVTRAWQHADVHDNPSVNQPMYPVPGRGVYIHAAYLDDRGVSPVIRIFGIHRNDTNLDDFRCEWNTSDGVMWQVNVKWTQIDRDWPLHNKYFALLITCHIPRHADIIPRAITLLPSGGDRVSVPVHNFRSIYDKRHKLAVCVKPMTGEFSVSRVVEWVELNLAAGYKHFIIYDTDLHGASRFVLDYYVSKGIVTVIRFPFLSSMLELAEKQVSLNGELRYALYQQVYLMSLHDCLYRFYHSYEYLAMIDLDEVIIPADNISINDVISRAERNIPEAVGSYMFYTSWHFQEFTKDSTGVPEFLYMQKYARSPTETVDQPKSIIHTDRTLTVNWHGLLDSLNSPNISRYLLSSWDYACVHHYRTGTCDEHFHELCANMTSTLSVKSEITRYRHVTETNVRKILNHLNMK